MTHIRPLSVALGEPYIQLNPPGMAAWLVLDVDRAGAALSWDAAGLPPPTFVASNPVNGHAHLGYALASPVCTTQRARRDPIRYLAAIEDAYAKAVRADGGFNGVKGKNPLHARWKLWEPANAPVYELSVLAEHVPELPSWVPRRREEASGLGRNCILFDDLSHWAYRSVRNHWGSGGDEWVDTVRSAAEAMNEAFPDPLPSSEVRQLARSVARWVWRRMSPEGFREHQAAVGAMKGEKLRREKLPLALDMHQQGFSNKSIAAALSVTPPTIANWLKRGRV